MNAFFFYQYIHDVVTFQVIKVKIERNKTKKDSNVFKQLFKKS